MPAELRLFFSTEQGPDQEVLVTTNPFTIGRAEGNDLVLNDTGLSRRHALITQFNEVVQLSDCGSQNGTFVNGRQISGATNLKNGDGISLGQHCKIRVQMVASGPSVNSLPATSAPLVSPSAIVPQAVTPQFPAPSYPPLQNSSALKFSPTVLASSVTALILIFSGALMGYLFWRKPPPPPPVNSGSSPIFTPAPPPVENEVDKPGLPPPPALSDQFEKTVVQVIRKISKDQDYTFSPDVLNEIKQRVGRYANTGLASVLSSLTTRAQDVAKQARDQGLNANLVVYLALAETNGGQPDDPVSAARQAIPPLIFLRGHFGGEFGDHALLLVAASRIPGGTKKSHPLLPRIRSVAKNPQKDRNVWFLHQHGALSNEAYEFVLKFLAYGVIAQNPRQFGLNAPALVF